ncbi:MAG: histidine phosphatase family protein [Sandaracinaceae bacterium]|nr:histidine phosphatase family protein [Sandaracinaceae bacterium]
MELMIVRHAIAEERRPDLDDEERALTPKGRKRFAQSAQALAGLGLRVDRIVHSPWRRAAETAALLAPICDAPPLASELLARAPDSALLELLAADRFEAPSLALVGHEPWLSELLAWLVVGDPTDGDARFELKKGAIALLSGTPAPGQMQLRALLPPRVLRG